MPGEKEGNDDDEDGVGDGVDDPDGIVWSDGVHPDLNEVMVASGVYGSPVISEEDRVKKAVLKAECLALDEDTIKEAIATLRAGKASGFQLVQAGGQDYDDTRATGLLEEEDVGMSESAPELYPDLVSSQVASESYAEALAKDLLACIRVPLTLPTHEIVVGVDRVLDKLPYRPTLQSYIESQWSKNTGSSLQVDFIRTWSMWLLYTVVRQYDHLLSVDTKNELAKNFPAHLSRPQKIGYLGGEGGSGKSFCVLGLVEFLTMWGCSKRVVVAAPTNLAACLINGQTWQSAFAHSERGSKEDGAEPADIATLRSARDAVLLFIMDEVSMVGASDLEVIDRKLKMIFQKDKVMGGTSVLFGGDMRQLPPVQKIPLYQYAAALKASDTTKLNIEGLSIWQTQMDVCHLLIGNFRAKTDPGWVKDLEEFRNGPSKALLEKLNNTLDTHFACSAK
jgi:hypothetical protein